MQTFRSKVDASFVMVVVITAAAAAGAVIGAVQHGFVLPAVVLFAAFGFVIWVWRTTAYEITDDTLTVHGGFRDLHIPLSSITAVRPTTTVLAAPALSLERLEVVHASGSVVISPADRERFVRLLLDRAPAATAHEMGDTDAAVRAQIRSTQRVCTIGASAALVLVASIGVLLGSVELSPPSVSISDDALRIVSRATSVAIAPEEIRAVELADSLPQLSRVTGVNSLVSLRGRFRSGDTPGFVHVSRRRPPFLVIRTVAQLVIINDSDPARTRAWYREIASRWSTTASVR